MAKDLFKNMMCGSIGLLVIFVTSIFVIDDYFSERIQKAIDEATLLKDYSYASWGQFPMNKKAEYTKKVTPYNITIQNDKAFNEQNDSNEQLIFDYTFSYSNITYGQGDQGTIQYANNWQLKLRNEDSLANKTISTINLGVQKIFSYEYYATPTRKFTLMYNQLRNKIENILPKFYALVLKAYYFADVSLVKKIVFTYNGIDDQTGTKIYNDTLYGWSNPQTFAKWIKMTHSPSRQSMPEYEQVQQLFGLTTKQVEGLVGPKSMLYKVSQALNGTIKCKIESNTYKFIDHCNPFCSNQELISLQIAYGLLTNTAIFFGVNLNKLTNDLDGALPGIIQYIHFCKNDDDSGGDCIKDKNIFSVFNTNQMANFTIMSSVFSNLDQFNIIEDIFDVVDPSGDQAYGKSIVAYIQYLQNQIFNFYDSAEDQTDFQAFKVMYSNRDYAVKAINRFKKFLRVQLYSRALMQNIIDTKITCQNHFQGDYANFANLCQDSKYNLKTLSSVRNYVNAYLFYNRGLFLNQTKMNKSQASAFLRLDTTKSLFAQKILQITSYLATYYQCQNKQCTEDQLAAFEWGGQKSIIQNLPINYFPDGNLTSLLAWDQFNIFKGQEPQYYKIAGQKISFNQSFNYISHTPNSILELSNMMKIWHNSKYDKNSKKMAHYIHKIALDIGLNQPFEKKSLSDAILGFKSDQIIDKKQNELLKGGAPWLSEKISLFQTSHSDTYLNKINTGIYNKNLLRSLSQIEESNIVSSQYTVFQSEYDHVIQRIKTQKKVFGTNLLGFHQNIFEDEKLTVFLDIAHSGLILQKKNSNQNKKGLTIYKYQFTNAGLKMPIGLEQLNQRWIIISPESYIQVQQATGITIEAKIIYSIYCNLPYLQYYFEGEQNNVQYKLFDVQTDYKLIDQNSIENINGDKTILRTLFTVAVVLAAVSMLLVLISGTLYCKKGRKVKKSSILETMITEQATKSLAQ